MEEMELVSQQRRAFGMKMDLTPLLFLVSLRLFFMLFGLYSEPSVLFLIGQPAAPSEGAAPLCQVGQAEPGSVPGPARAAATGHEHHLPSRLL